MQPGYGWGSWPPTAGNRVQAVDLLTACPVDGRVGGLHARIVPTRNPTASAQRKHGHPRPRILILTRNELDCLSTPFDAWCAREQPAQTEPRDCKLAWTSNQAKIRIASFTCRFGVLRIDFKSAAMILRQIRKNKSRLCHGTATEYLVTLRLSSLAPENLQNIAQIDFPAHRVAPVKVRYS